MMKDRKEEFSGISRIYEKYNPVIQFRNRGVNERMVNILNSPNFILFFRLGDKSRKNIDLLVLQRFMIPLEKFPTFGISLCSSRNSATFH